MQPIPQICTLVQIGASNPLCASLAVTAPTLFAPIPERNTVHAHSLTTLRSALGNVDAATRRTVRMPRRPLRPPLGERDYLGWRDPSAPQRGYLFIERAGTPTGIMLTTTRTRMTQGRAVMCEFCRLPRRFEQVALFTAPTTPRRGAQSTIGTYLCVDLDCNARVNRLQPLTPLDPPAEELVATRREQLAERSTAFITEVLRQAALSGAAGSLRSP